MPYSFGASTKASAPAVISLFRVREQVSLYRAPEITLGRPLFVAFTLNNVSVRLEQTICCVMWVMLMIKTSREEMLWVATCRERRYHYTNHTSNYKRPIWCIIDSEVLHTRTCYHVPQFVWLLVFVA